jgi:spermidine synthase
MSLPDNNLPAIFRIYNLRLSSLVSEAIFNTPFLIYCAMRTMNFLEELGEKYAATKRNHDYLRHYWLHFKEIRLQVKQVLEIGVFDGSSLRMWSEFFPNATIYGIDIDPSCKAHENERIKITIGDQGDRNFLEEYKGKFKKPFDIIIDDGSHKIEHQLLSFEVLFSALSSHGMYAIEDTGGCVGDENLITVNALKKCVDNIFFWPRGLDGGQWSYLSSFDKYDANWWDKHVTGIAFYRWLVIVMKGRNPEDNPYLL